MCRSYTYVSEHTTKDSSINIYGIFKRKEFINDIWQVANLKYKYGNRTFWCRGYYVDTVGRNKERIAQYIKNQIEEDKIMDQMTLKEYFDPFNVEKK